MQPDDHKNQCPDDQCGRPTDHSRPPQHGVDGWVLEDMEWDPDTGVSVFEYSSTVGQITRYEVRAQPTQEGHLKWEMMRGMPSSVLTIK